MTLERIFQWVCVGDHPPHPRHHRRMSTTVLVIVVVIVVTFLIVRGRRHPGTRAIPSEFERVSPRHASRAAGIMTAFDRDYQRTFDGSEVSKDPEGAVRRLFAHRAATLQALNETRFRLPNDLTMERELDAAIEDIDRDMLERIDDARQRCGMDLLHPGPVDAAWYGAWYRAANDVVE